MKRKKINYKLHKIKFYGAIKEIKMMGKKNREKDKENKFLKSRKHNWIENYYQEYRIKESGTDRYCNSEIMRLEFYWIPWKYKTDTATLCIAIYKVTQKLVNSTNECSKHILGCLSSISFLQNPDPPSTWQPQLFLTRL